MSDVLSPDAALTTEIARLKSTHSNTRELYREVCALLFFRFGITPTANRLYQLVQGQHGHAHRGPRRVLARAA
jgi:hypothetical protein